MAKRTLEVLMKAAMFGRGIFWDRFTNRCPLAVICSPLTLGSLCLTQS